MYCKFRKKCIINKFKEEINNLFFLIWFVLIFYNIGKFLKYMYILFCLDKKRFCGGF